MSQADSSRHFDPFARYSTPAECAMARARLERQYWRALRPDTIYAGPYGRSPVSSTIAGVRQCVARFVIDSVPQRDLLGLGHAYLAGDQDQNAGAAFQRLLRLSREQPTSKQAWTLAQIVKLYTTVTPTTPARIALAHRYLALLDSIGKPAAAERMLAYLDLFDAARRADSVGLMEIAVRAALAASKEMVGDIQKQRATQSAEVYKALAHVHMRNRDYAGAVAALQEGLTTLTPFRQSVRYVLEPVLKQYQLLGRPAPQVQATQWFNRPTRQTLHIGVPTIITLANHHCAADVCYPGYNVMRRLRASPHGWVANAIFAVRTSGYDDNRRLVPPERELEQIGQYYIDTLALPIVVAAWQTVFELRSDQRLSIVSAPNEEAFPADPYGPLLQTYVVDKDGIVRFITVLHPYYEAELNNVVKELQ